MKFMQQQSQRSEKNAFLFGKGRRLIAYAAVLTMLAVTILSWAPTVAMANSDNGGGLIA
ncbi:MAG: hypothetical protein LBN12_06580 [Clostridiales Family XIII bacterium]|jgi:hypothetical protein|nr:hypothetical protein [Clostridiales Family XIII bacterium]